VVVLEFAVVIGNVAVVVDMLYTVVDVTVDVTVVVSTITATPTTTATTVMLRLLLLLGCCCYRCFCCSCRY